MSSNLAIAHDLRLTNQSMASQTNEESNDKSSLESVAKAEGLRVTEPSLWQLLVRFWRSDKTEETAKSESPTENNAKEIDEESQ